MSRVLEVPAGPVVEPLGRLLYLAHLLLLLWWLLDRSPGQGATRGLLRLVARASPLLGLALGLPGASALVAQADRLVREGLFGEGA